MIVAEVALALLLAGSGSLVVVVTTTWLVRRVPVATSRTRTASR